MRSNSREIKTALSIVQQNIPSLRANKTLRHFADIGFGRIIGRNYVIDRQGREGLKQWLGTQGVDWQSPIGGLFEGSREEVASRSLNEKNARLLTGQGRLLISALGDGIKINGRPLPLLPVNDAFVSVGPEAVEEVTAQAIVLVENSRAFHRMRDFQHQSDLTGHLAV